MQNSSQRVVLITGASRGIGRYLVEQFCSEGYIVCGCSRSTSSFEAKNYFHYVCDVSEESQVIKMLSEIRKTFKKLDVLVNNAGVASMNHFLLTPSSSLEKIFKVNLFGTFLLSREAAKLLQKSESPRIINFTTIAVALSLEGEAVYVSAKAAVESLTKVLAKELGSFNITVNAIGPTPIKTDLIKNVPEDKIEVLLSRQAIKRFGEMIDVKNCIDFFMSEKSDFISGQVIYLGGIVK